MPTILETLVDAIKELQDRIEKLEKAPIAAAFNPHRVYNISGNTERFGEESVRLESNGYTGKASAAVTFNSYALHDNGGGEVSSGGDGCYVGDFYRFANNMGVRAPGQGVGVQGFITGDQDGCGVSGCAFTTTPKVRSIATAGVAGNTGNGAASVGLYGSLVGFDEKDLPVNIESACCLLDNRNTKTSLLKGRTQNGKLVFEFNSKGELMLPPPVGFSPFFLSVGLGTGDTAFMKFPSGRVRQFAFKD